MTSLVNPQTFEKTASPSFFLTCDQFHHNLVRVQKCHAIPPPQTETQSVESFISCHRFHTGMLDFVKNQSHHFGEEDAWTTSFSVSSTPRLDSQARWSHLCLRLGVNVRKSDRDAHEQLGLASRFQDTPAPVWPPLLQSCQTSRRIWTIVECLHWMLLQTNSQDA